MIPSTIDESTTSPAERLLFRELNIQLGTDYLVLHSVKWVSHERGRQHDGEADFLIAHPDLGVLVLEVKGGTIRRVGGDRDEWYSRDFGGEEHRIQNPFVQAERSMYSLQSRLETTATTAGFTYPMARTVAFPDVVVQDGWLGVDINRSTIIDSRNLFLLANAIRAAMSGSGKQGPGKAGVNALLELVRPSFTVEREGLAAGILRENAEILRLTDQQLALLDALAGHRRIAINGTAGSGKTVMAREHARRLAGHGHRVLLTCFNKALAAALREDLAGLPLIEVRTYHDLAERLVERAGMTIEGERDAEYFNHRLPEAMAEAIGVLDDRFDAIVVDEGQDFADIWWVTLEALLKEPESGFLAIFYDDNQRIFGDRASAYPIPPPHFTLTRNCRCTNAIHTAACAYMPLASTVWSGAPEGRAIECIPIGSRGPVDAARQAIHRLTVEEGIPLGEIVILTPRNKVKTAFQHGTPLGNHALDWEGSGPKSIQVRNLHAFKGLESPVVILAECDAAHEATRNRLMYVALTRARNHVIVIGEQPPAL